MIGSSFPHNKQIGITWVVSNGSVKFIYYYQFLGYGIVTCYWDDFFIKQRLLHFIIRLKKRIINKKSCGDSMHIDIVDGETWREKLEALPRLSSSSVTAFYEHRIGAICKDVRYLLAPIDDHLVHRGDGIFESLKLDQGKILELDAHIQRLKRSAETLGLVSPLAWDELREIIIAVARAGGEPEGTLKLLMGRGEGGLGISPKECPVASFYCIAAKTNPLPASFWEKGLTACRSKIPAKSAFMAQIKSTNYLPNVFMAQEAEDRGVGVSICFDYNGYLAEAAIANVAMIDAKGVFVLPHFRHALPGTTALLAKSLAEECMQVEVRDIYEKELYDAKEILLLGTGPECVAITHYEGQAIGEGKPGKMAKMLRELIHTSLLTGGTPFLD